MKRMMILFLFPVFLSVGCKKEEPCQINATGTLCIDNQTFVDVGAVIDGIPGFTVPANSTVCKENISSGVRSYNILAADLSSSWTDEVDIRQCAENTITLRR